MCACCITLYIFYIDYIDFKKYIDIEIITIAFQFLCNFLLSWQTYMKAEGAQAFVKFLLNLEV